MRLVVIGVNHKTAPIALRERLAFADDLPTALTALKLMTAGVFIVSTCNRSEIYAYLDNPDLDDDSDNELINLGVDACPQSHRLIKWLAAF